MPIDIEEKYLLRVKNIIKSQINDADLRIYLFGSRARGNAKKYSDLDIALDLEGQKINHKILTKIIIELEETTIPYKIDVVDLNDISDEFKRCIEKDLTII